MMVEEGRAHGSALTIFSPDALTRPACQIFPFRNDLKELVGKRSLKLQSIFSRRVEPDVILLRRGEDYRHRFRMDWSDHAVGL